MAAAFASDGPLLVLCGGLVVLGVVLRCQALGFPRGMSFDEHHFVENARNYLAGRPDWNDHPPLGKFLIAAGIRALGDNPVGWRIVPLLLGLANIALGGALAQRLFGRREAGWIAAAFFAADGFLLAYSRTALLDGMLSRAACSAPRWRSRARARREACCWRRSLPGRPPRSTSAARRWRSRWRSRGSRSRAPSAGRGLAAMTALPLVYMVTFLAFGLRLTGLPSGPLGVLGATRKLVVSHLAATSMTHPLTSYWYTWFLPTRPITLRFDVLDHLRVRGMTMLGNLALWWGGELAIAGDGGPLRAALDRARPPGRLAVALPRAPRSRGGVAPAALGQPAADVAAHPPRLGTPSTTCRSTGSPSSCWPARSPTSTNAGAPSCSAPWSSSPRSPSSTPPRGAATPQPRRLERASVPLALRVVDRRESAAASARPARKAARPHPAKPRCPSTVLAAIDAGMKSLVRLEARRNGTK